ncbi:uncharacterized protein LOC144260827 isoform X1 [Eretmochelys imbricata]
MATVCQTHGGGLNQCHLRSIGRKASVFGVAEVIHFYKAVTLIGRNKDVVDYFISGPVSERRDYISRTHARVIRTNDTYRLVDSSLTGVYVNDVRINGTINLQEGDTVTFGHPAGNGIRSGTRVRQPNSEFYFLFEHCYCRIDQLQSACGEIRNSLPQVQLPLLTSPEVPPVYNAGLVFENNVGLPIISQLAWTSQVVPNSGAPSKSSTHCGDMQPPTVIVTLPLTSAGSVLSSVKSSLCTNSVNVTSNKLEMPATSTSAATADTSLENYTRPNSQIVRSSSPEYVHRKDSTVTTEPSQQRVFEIAQSSFRENAARTAELANSDFLCVKPSGAQPCTLGSMSKFYRPFLDERQDSGEIETQPPVTYNLEPSPPFPHSRGAVETHDSDPSGKAIVRASLSDNSLDLSDSFQVESGGNLDSKPLVPVADKSVLGSCANSDDDVVMEINVINSTEETAKHETSRHSEPYIQMQVTEVINEAMKNVQVPSVSDYKANLMEKESSTEEENRYSLEQHIVDACVHETPCLAVSIAGAETCESHSKKKGRLRVNSLSELVIVEVENCSENSDCMAISIVPEDIALGKDLDGGSPAKEVVSPKKLVNADGKTCVEELDLPSETAVTIDRTREVNISFVPDLELPHSVRHSEMKNEICKDELTSVIKQDSLMPKEEAIKESSDIVECESFSLADGELETLNNTLHMETQKPETTLDIQEGAEPNTDKIITISNREVREIHSDHVFEDKLQNALDQDYMFSDTGIINLEHQNSSDAHKILTMCAAKEMSGSECNIGSAKFQENEDDSVSGVALFQSCVTEQVVSRASGTNIVQCLDMLHSEEEGSSMDSHVALDGLVTKILQNNSDPTAPENLPLCTQNISDYHVHSPSKHHILSQDTYLEDVTYESPCNCVPSSSGSLHSERSPHQPAPKEEELRNSGAVVKPLSGTFCSLQATAVEMTSPEYPCRYEDSGAFTSVKRSISETMSQETNIQPLSQNETETSVEQNACNKANISHATVCIESEGFQSDHVYMTTSVSTKGVPQEVSDFGINKIHLEVSASEGDEEQTGMNVNAISLTMGSPVRYGDKDESESKMDSMDTETRISLVTDCVEISYAEVGTQTRLINERAINLLATKPAVNGNKNSVSNTSICEEEVNMSMDTHLSLQQFSEAYERTILFNNASKNSWREFSKQMEIDSTAKEKLSSETRIKTFDEKTVFVASCSSPNTVTFWENTEKLVEAMNPESPINVGEEFLDRCLLQKSDCTLERKRSPGKEEDESYVSVFSSNSLSTTNTRCIKTVEILVRHTLDSTLNDNNEMYDTDCQELKTACSVVDDTASGEKQLDQSASIENTFYKKTDEDSIKSKEIMKIPGERHDSGTAINDSIFEEQKNIENKGINKEMEIMANMHVGQTNLNHSSVTKAPTNRLEGNTAYYSSELEGGIANDLSPLCLSKQTSLKSELLAATNDYSCSQTQSPYYVNKRDMGNNPEPVNDYILPQQDTRNEEGMKLNDENTGEAVNCKWSVKSVTLEKDNADAHFSELDLGTLNNYQENNENSSVSAAHLELRQQSSAFHDQQETDSHAVESQHLESNIDLKSKEDPVKQSLYPEDFVVDCDLKKLCEQNMTTEILTPTALERSNQKSICQEEGGIKLQTSEMDTQPCSVDKNDLAVGMQAIAFGKPESAKENIAENHLKEIENDPTEGSELFSGEELNLYISDSEVEKEKEENNSMRMKNTVEMQHDRSKILKEKDTVIFDPNSVSGSIILQADLDCKPNEDQLDRVIETAVIKSVIGTETSTDRSLEGKCYSLCNAEYDLSEVRIAGPENCSTGVVVGEFSHLVKSPTLRQEKTENQITAERDLGSLRCPYNSIEFPCVPGSQREMEAVKGNAEVGLNKGDAGCSDEHVGNADSNSIQAGKNLEENPEPAHSLLDGCIQELEVGTLAVPLGALKTVKDSPVNEMLTSLCAEKDKFNQKTETNELVYMHEESKDSEPLKSQAKICQPTGCADFSEGSNEDLTVSESNFTNRVESHKEENKDSQNKEANKNNSFRTLKRHISRNEYFGTSVSEDEQCCSQKRNCPLGSLSMQEFVSDLPSPNVILFSIPTGLKECHDQFVSSSVKKFFKKYPILQTAQHRDEVEKENSKNIAQLVREFFKKTNDSENLVNENTKPERFVPSIKSKVEEDTDCKSIGEVDSERRDGSSLLLFSSIEPQVNGKQSVKLISESQSLPFDSQSGFTELAASSEDSWTYVLEKDVVSKIPESPSADSLSEEEQFQSRVCLALDNLYTSAKSPLKSPDINSEQSTKIKDLDFIFSDISNSSVETEHHQLTRKLSSSSSSGTGDGLHEGICSDSCKAAGLDTQSGFSCNSLEASAVYWSDEDTNITSDLIETSRESSQCVISNLPQQLESEDHAESIKDKNYMPILHRAERTLDGVKTPNIEDLSVPAFCVNSITGAVSSSQKIILKVESDAVQHEVPEFDGHNNTQNSEISCLQTKSVCSPCKDLTPAATVDWNANSPIQEQITSHIRLCINSQAQLKRELSHEEHGDSGNRSSISPPSKMCPPVVAISSESADEEPAPNQKEIGSPDASGSCSTSQTSLTEHLTQTPSKPEAKHSLSLKKLKSSYASIPPSAVKVSSSSQKTVDSNVSRCLQSSYVNSQLELSSSKLPPPEASDSAEMINSHHERTDKEEDFAKDNQHGGPQNQKGQTNLYDYMDGRVALEPCIAVGSKDRSDLQTTNDFSSMSSVPELEGMDLSRSTLNSLACEPAAFPGFKEENLQCSLQVQTLSDTSGHCSLDFKEYPTTFSPVISTLHKCGASETSVSSLPDHSFQPTSMANLQIQDRVLSPCTFEACTFSQPASEHVCSSDEEASCHSEDLSEDMEEFPSMSTESSSAIGLLSETKNLGNLSDAENSAHKASSSNTNITESELQKAWALSEGDIEFQLSQCQTVLDDISQTLCAVEGIDKVHMEEWREQIEKLQKDTKMPKTYIAVVGNTGAGKSSLLNALLDEEAVLPTSAMRACTAVVVEISKTGGKSLYEADVEFLSKEEWDNELKALLEDMKDKSGNLKKRCPDRKTEAGAAYSRVKAVYGTIAELPKLKEMKEVTQHLGTVKHISAEKAADFRTKIEKFIDSRTDNLRDMKGGEFWPIVKCVKIRVPGANVLKTGAVLVDLPGVRDSNAARDNAAKEYLKNCNAVWVVANITRAVDDKTAKEMLSANLRRQLLMDGQYGSLAFVCTKTDSFNVTEIMSDLDLRDEIQPMEKSLEELENQRVQMEMEKDTLYTQLQQEQQRQGPGAENPASFQKENDLRKKILEKEFRISKLQREKDMKLRDISLICVQSRNRFSKQRIWVDFNNGLQEMRRKAAYDEDEEEEETEDEELTTSDTSDPGEVESQHGKLLVFTVSSTEYLKLHGKLLRDGQPQVFHNEEDTEIPALKKFAIQTALQHSMVATEKVIRNVARVISQVVNYLTNQRAEDNSHRAQVQEIVQECLSRLPTIFQEAVEDSLHDIKYYFSVLILASLKKGARRAEELCEDKVRSWGLPVIGYPYATYRAVCARQGVYSSGACGFVDFNEQLTEPISSAISMTWNDVFSCRLGESIKQFSKAILDKLKYFFRDLKNKLQEKGRNTEPVSVIQRHQMEAVQALMCNFLLDQTEYINKRQRGISRVLTPEIQASMKSIYAVCSQLNGPGCFQRMKDLMQRHVRNQKETMFNCVTDKLRHQLDLLQIDIGGSFECLVQELTKSLNLQFEPMLKRVQKNDGIIPVLVNICAKVSKICKISRVDYVLPNLNQTESCSVPASPGRRLPLKRELQEGLDPPNFLGKCNIIHIGTMTLSHINPIQISVQEVAVTMTDHTTMTLPFSSVYLCECCFHLYYLILHVSPEFAKNIYSRLGAQASNPSNQEVLIILDKPQDPSSFHSLVEFISARHGGIPWFRELNLQQGREKLESLGVYYTVKVSHHEFCMLEDLKYDDEEKTLEVSPSSSPSDQPTVFTIAQQPLLPGVKLYSYGRKRGGGEIQSQLEKKHKGKTIEQSPEVEPAGFHLPSQHVPGRLVVSARPSMASHLQNASRECASAFYELNTTSFPGMSMSEAPSSSHVTVKDENDLFTIPSAAGILHGGAKEGVWGKWENPNAQEDNSSDVDKMETNGNTHTAKDSWSPH